MRKLLALALLLPACSPPTPAVPEREITTRVVGAGTPDDPVLRCGPGDSYYYVARRYRCAGGEAASSWKRLGSLPSSRNGDILDQYAVRCPEGEATVFVDMYGCEEPAAERRAGRSAEAAQAVIDLEQGRFGAARAQCEQLLSAHPPAADTVQCFFVLTAAASLSGGDDSAVAAARRVCGRMPPASPKSDVRSGFLSETMRWVIRGQGKSHLTREGFDALEAKLAAACEVPLSQVHTGELRPAQKPQP